LAGIARLAEDRSSEQAMEIRYLTAEDAGEWLRLRLEALQSDPEAFSASFEEYQSLSLEEVRKRLGFEGKEAFVVGAFENGRLQGCAGFYRDKGLKTRHKGRVWGVYVTPERRGAGVGKKMLQMLVERGSALHGIQQILLSVTTTQVAAVRLYRSLGFTSSGYEPRALKIDERFIDEEYLVLRVR
jgi:ribosomal protein S18 acetylase RimI-like enzyme